MGCRSLLTAAALVATLGVTAPPLLAQQATSDRVLAQSDTGFNPSAVRGMISRGDAAAARGDLASARIEYDKARKVSKTAVVVLSRFKRRFPRTGCTHPPGDGRKRT